MTPQSQAEVERQLWEVPKIHRMGHPGMCVGDMSCADIPDYPALAARVWAWLEEEREH